MGEKKKKMEKVDRGKYRKAKSTTANVSGNNNSFVIFTLTNPR